MPIHKKEPKNEMAKWPIMTFGLMALAILSFGAASIATSPNVAQAESSTSVSVDESAQASYESEREDLRSTTETAEENIEAAQEDVKEAADEVAESTEVDSSVDASSS